MQHCPTCGSPLSGQETTCPVCGSPLAFPDLPPGTSLAGGRYVVGRVLGHGGFGITYEATDTALGRRVALKELFPDGAVRHTTQLIPPTRLGPTGFFEARQRFIEEARTLAQFNHPGIVRVFDVFEENGTAYLAMEFLEGETLGRRIERWGPRPQEEVEEIARKVAEALEVVHQAGLLHRDIKPDNLFLTPDGRVVLIDFGAARDYAQGRTVAHTRMVTPGYAPLEQYASSARLGPYTDIYALGATLYHALSGSPPPAATDRATGTPLPPLPPGTATGLARLITRSLGMKITDRPASVDRLLAELDQPSPIREPILQDPPLETFPPRRRGRARRRGSAVQGCGCGCLTFLGVFLLVAGTGVFPDQAIWIALIAAVIVMFNFSRAR
jgi:serine/threonine-protein kinase